MKKKMSLKNIFLEFKGKISITLGLLITENAFTILQPFFLGLAINDLIDDKYTGLIYFTSLYISSLIVGVARRMYDTRAYTHIYNVAATSTVKGLRDKEVKTSAIVTRSNLVHELIDFFENDLTQGITSIIGIIGAVVMLAIFDIRLFIGCMVAIVCIYIIYSLSEKRILLLNKKHNDELETQVDKITDSSIPKVFKHFKILAKWQVKLSDLESLNFGIIDLVLLSLAIFSLFISVQTNNPTPGAIFAILSYVLEFAEGIMWLPAIFQQMIRLKEIGGRIENDAEIMSVDELEISK